MNRNTYVAVSAAIFLIVALVHLLRLFQGFEVQIAGLVIPMWASWIGVLVAGFLAISGLRLYTR